MMKNSTVLRMVGILTALCLLISCSRTPKVLGSPAELYAEIAAAAALPEMVTLTAEEMFDVLGIDPAWYTASAVGFASDGTSPEEILIFLAADESAARSLAAMLEARLAYKRESAERYLTENQSMLEDGVVRCDGLTVSLLVCADIDAAEQVFP